MELGELAQLRRLEVSLERLGARVEPNDDCVIAAACPVPNATCATALIDRTVHHADVIAIEGESYRRREAEADKKTRRGGNRGKKAAA